MKMASPSFGRKLEGAEERELESELEAGVEGMGGNGVVEAVLRRGESSEPPVRGGGR